MSTLGNKALEAGRIYRVTGGIRTEMLRTEIYHAWERAHLQGANPNALQAEKLSNVETERLIDKYSNLINLVRPYFRNLSQAAGQEHHAVMLSDANAILLDLIGDEETIQSSESFPSPGSLLSEAVAGANGIGTTLAEGNYVEIVAAEHFIEGFHPFTCQGIPLRNEKHEIIGVLSISLRSPQARQRLKEIFLCASRGIEAEFIIANLEKNIHRVLTSNPDDYQPLEELRQDIIQGHQAARLKLEISSRMLAVNRLEYAMKLIKQAEQSIQIFRNRADIWRNLASFDVGKVQVISITDSLSGLVDLLSTEAAIRKVEVITDWQESITIIADLRSLSRQLLRYFLQSFESAGKGGTLRVAVAMMPNSESVQVNFTSIPGLNTSHSEPANYVFYIPLK
ncbi:sigma-54-dependent Fis family transcriptional regulator [Anabaena sp. UHCC 0451]|uniref:sigma-54-dependent Fis family transcriptional regulator n=1 Tax=Anabaena sp. UHCC 0451 TaxID=2055235 RepID=UPI002B21867F|nr:sigma-54-dependent Fis family transcriptional regulator [Anabaena sp. UHCC 0451]MEA5577262.1 sigma-54-dependent Fis family transcriptional regulator [Anabaena sp. UHCC 0451]